MAGYTDKTTSYKDTDHKVTVCFHVITPSAYGLWTKEVETCASVINSLSAMNVIFGTVLPILL